MLKLASVKLHGIATTSAKEGDTASFWVRHALTSEYYQFHPIAEGMVSLLQHAAEQSGHRVNVRRASNILAVIRQDETADLFLDAAAIVVTLRRKLPTVAGQPIFANEVTDILSVSFPTVSFAPTDQVLFLFREGFRFGLFFDLKRELDQAEMERAIGGLMRQLKHHEAYAALSNPNILNAMTAAGWFPFIELHGGEFAHIYAAMLETQGLSTVEGILVEAFNRDRIEGMLGRWTVNETFRKREPVLRSGLDAFTRQDPVAAIKILATEIEGILRATHLDLTTQIPNTQGLVHFAAAEANRKAGGPDTLYFPEAFERYLMTNMYRSFDPRSDDTPAWRHATAHGAAPAEAYTMTRALQVVLTLDQLSTYLS